MAEKTSTSRRDLLIGIAALGGVAYGWQAYVNRGRAPQFTPLPGLPGWRQATFDGISEPGGNVSAAIFAGIDDGTPPIEPLPVADLEQALYKGANTPTRLAVFSDFFCPYCRSLTQRIAERARDDRSLSVTWHELPLLGPASEIAARAGIAADLQGGYAPFQARLMASAFRPTPRFLGQVATASGLDPRRLIADMESETVAARLMETRRAAATLGIYGTPAMTLGKTLIMGEVSDPTLDGLIDA